MSKLLDMSADVLTTAIEGGTNYWAQVSNIERDDDMRVRSVTFHYDNELDVEEKVNVTDKAVLVTIVRLAIRALADIKLADEVEVIPNPFECRLIRFCGLDDDVVGDIDADDADNIIQLTIFGTVVYG